ncbi:two-component system response regulator GlrR [Plasticicumulans lactativorans]|uniref:Two-component system response regulator GlrR n=1 Tax=Plasticicumulans lactativorans TaxID=1133106 RepID=A0A4R2L7L7_9GAMM|nr:sigma 54-interacting transcriptional regulator [Plasticicumulans lactativorans]TCO81968.1 two-component system response regulator GlrR [Plasticicumulans lactativorans]
MSTTPRRCDILLVDDDADLLRLVSLRLRAAKYVVETAASGEEALNRLPLVQPRLLITDLRMPGMDGLALFEAVRAQRPGLPVIILTAHGTIPDAVQATREGVFGFLPKPFDPQDLLAQVSAALALSAPAEGGDAAAWRAAIITRSPLLEAVLDEALLVAKSEASVFIHGDSGTGKELLAQAIHKASPRAAGPFVAVNCSAIPSELLESELFGHVKGAFTGAAGAHKGLFVAADGGSLFLDEIGDLPLPMQAKLLRVLQERQVRPVGSTQSVAVDVRILSATHRDLDELLAQGQFREDLYYRLNVVALHLPPLRERREDIPLLVAHLLARLAEKAGEAPKRFAPEALEALVGADWPGNVRQLQNVVEHCVALAVTPVIPLALVRRALRDRAGQLPSLAEARDGFERDYLIRVLQLTGGNVTQAARLAQRNRTEFYKLLARHGLEPALFKGGDEP